MSGGLRTSQHDAAVLDLHDAVHLILTGTEEQRSAVAVFVRCEGISASMRPRKLGEILDEVGPV